jgi:hypothetical protein
MMPAKIAKSNRFDYWNLPIGRFRFLGFVVPVILNEVKNPARITWQEPGPNQGFANS